MHYDLSAEDFKKVFEFGVNYYIDPTKITSGRTTGEPRGLGAILDAFALGKLTEIAVEKILHNINDKKEYILDFSIKKISEVTDEPDIINISENDISREPDIFIEIKNTSTKDRWIGLTEEQLDTIKRSAGWRDIYFIYASIESEGICDNFKTKDLTGMFLKSIEDTKKSNVFQSFANLNAKCKIEFVISLKELLRFGYPFESGMYMYETELFKEKKRSSFISSKGIRKDIIRIKKFSNFNSEIELDIKTGVPAENKDISMFRIKGSFELFKKKKSTAIYTKSKVFIRNNIFGSFELEKDKFYSFNLETVGRHPELKRNNIFISKRRLYQLTSEEQIEDSKRKMRYIAENI